MLSHEVTTWSGDGVSTICRSAACISAGGCGRDVIPGAVQATAAPGVRACRPCSGDCTAWWTIRCRTPAACGLVSIDDTKLDVPDTPINGSGVPGGPPAAAATAFRKVRPRSTWSTRQPHGLACVFDHAATRRSPGPAPPLKPGMLVSRAVLVPPGQPTPSRGFPRSGGSACASRWPFHGVARHVRTDLGHADRRRDRRGPDGPRDRVHARRPATPRPPRETRPDDDAARCRRPSGDRVISSYHQRWEEEILFDEQKTHHDPVRPGKPALCGRHRRCAGTSVVAGPLRRTGPCVAAAHGRRDRPGSPLVHGRCGCSTVPAARVRFDRHARVRAVVSEPALGNPPGKIIAGR